MCKKTFEKAMDEQFTKFDEIHSRWRNLQDKRDPKEVYWSQGAYNAYDYRQAEIDRKDEIIVGLRQVCTCHIEVEPSETGSKRCKVTCPRCIAIKDVEKMEAGGELG